MKFLDLDGLRKVWQEIKKDMSSKLGKENIIDNLDSTSTTDALSANQGKILNDKITSNTKKVKIINSKIIENCPKSLTQFVNDWFGDETHSNSDLIADLNELNAGTIPLYIKRSSTPNTLFSVSYRLTKDESTPLGYSDLWLCYTDERADMKRIVIIFPERGEEQDKNAVWLGTSVDINLESRLVAEATLDIASNKLTVSGLDIIRDGGVYDIVIAENATASSPGGHVLRVNDLTSGYHSSFIIASGAAQGATNLFRKEYVTTGLCYTNGWNQTTRVWYATGTLIYYNANRIGFNGQSFDASGTDEDYVNLVNGGAVINQNVENITSLNITASDGQIAAGSWIKVYKR